MILPWRPTRTVTRYTRTKTGLCWACFRHPQAMCKVEHRTKRTAWRHCRELQAKGGKP